MSDDRTYYPNQNEKDDSRDDEDYGDEYGWWDEYESALEDENFCNN